MDEKIQRLSEGPTNSIDGVYSLNPPGFRLGEKDPAKTFYPDVDGNWPAGIPGIPGELSYTRPEGYWSGESDWDSINQTDFSQDYLLTDPTGTSTAGLIAENGTVLSQLPPGGQAFILGPIVDGFVPNHTSDAYTNIGYLQKDTRQFVLLARIQGQWRSNLNGNYPIWNGSSDQLTIYNQNFTLAMAEWVKDQIVTSENFTPNVPYFYSGGVPQIPQSDADCPNCPPGMYGGNGVGGNSYGSGGNPNVGNQQGSSSSGGPGAAGYPSWGNTRGGDAPPPPRKRKDEDEIAQLSDTTDRNIDMMLLKGLQRGDYGTGSDIDKQIKNLQQNIRNNTPGGRGLPQAQADRNTQVAHYKPQGQVLSENRRRILREIKKPYVLPEIPKQKYKMNFSGKFKPQNTPDVTASSKSDELVASGNAKGQKWRLKDKYWQGYETTERMNIIYDRVGHGDQAWEMIIGENQNKKREHARKLQEHLNTLAHERVMRQENVDYVSPFRLAIQEQETMQADKDPLFKRVSKRLKKEIDYADKPAKNGYPNDPPPEMVNGWNPEYGKDKGYYNKLDPQSAEAMPPTGDPEIDQKVRAAAKKPK